MECEIIIKNAPRVLIICFIDHRCIVQRPGLLYVTKQSYARAPIGSHNGSLGI